MLINSSSPWRMSSSISLRALIRTASTLSASTASCSLLRSPLPLLLFRPSPLCRQPFRSISDDSSDTQASLQQSLNFVKLPGLSEEDERRFQILQFEVDVLRQSGYKVPSAIAEEEWRELLAKPSKHSRLKYYNYLFKSEMGRLKVIRQKERKAEKRQEKFDAMVREREEAPDRIQYGLGHNTFFPYIRDADMLQAQNYKLARARCIGQPLVVDLGFDEWMTEREQVNCATQLRDAYAYNRDARDPFWLQFCNVNFQGHTYKAMEGAIGNINLPSCLLEFSEKSYLDLFPKEKIVYLTPNAEYNMREFNEDDVYVIGAIVDRSQSKPLTLAKAKREGLRMAKLPIDVYLRWAVGSKYLALNHVISLLVDVKRNGDWEAALRAHIPKRKVFQPEDEAAETLQQPRVRANQRLVHASRNRDARNLMAP
ncbi:mitochondrial ribonuclease P protein 1 homolog isoform X2 [Paramacrobiotus metropolitanus]|uniref:mitochondrial ribonuclease P protein 1 homolog isoform X2 n=1 Tax=Paramacrobiotus metropolitanus TaxID=2943436 RepID=UPI002445DBA1|nr:mitochondrial ribonuclease P protein 1 homolog isoform X2 [Paramacrobiotus metropolitanus]